MSTTLMSNSAPSEMDLRYPVGKFLRPAGPVSAPDRTVLLHVIETLPEKLGVAVAGLSDDQLEATYRPGGWTLRQVVHHVADSHINSYVRFRWTLTEDSPLIKAYDEKAWAELLDAKSAPAALSLSLLAAVHARWTLLLRSMDEAAFAKVLVHPQNGEMRLDTMLALYAWHSRHHTAHITEARRPGAGK
jgi:uncharacterized damage-inducible protein DinB